MTLRFADLNPLGRVIIVVVAGLTLSVAAVAFATSYGALYAFIKDTGLYSDTGRYADRLNQAWPLLLDATFIVAQLAAILAGILRGSRGWPILTMLLTGSLTVWFNLQHAGADPGRRLAAALPPVLMMLAFEIDVSIVRWVMRALGKPMEAASPLPPGVLAGPVPGAIYRPDGLVGTIPQGGPYALWGQVPYGQVASSASSENQQNGQSEVTKRQQVEAYLGRLSSDQLGQLTAREITAGLTDQGMDVSERYVAHILDQWTAARRGSGGRRRAGR
jgi:hypothetical protein